METITISPDFKIVIPRSIREKLRLEPGENIHAMAYDNRIELIPVTPISSMRGFLRGIDTGFEREPDGR
jgi:AbrB family looped-hinge helix DNA binding protein